MFTTAPSYTQVHWCIYVNDRPYVVLGLLKAEKIHRQLHWADSASLCTRVLALLHFDLPISKRLLLLSVKIIFPTDSSSLSKGKVLFDAYFGSVRIALCSQSLCGLLTTRSEHGLYLLPRGCSPSFIIPFKGKDSISLGNELICPDLQGISFSPLLLKIFF